jgi:mono/diheme cytochrome c family protein
VSDPTGSTRDPTRRDPVGVAGVLLAALALALVVAGVAVAAWYGGKGSAATTTVASPPATSYPKVSASVAAGAHDFTRFACSQCHGDRGVGGVSTDVPALTSLGPTLTEATLTHIIETGLGSSSNPTKPFMPVWKAIISKTQIHDLVSYLHAGLPPVRDAQPLEVPTDQGPAVAGSILYVNFGCVNCHGPNGLGGVPNPQSPDKTVPSLASADFRAEFNTPKKIADIIVSGSVIGKQPIVSMPHWGTILTQTEINDLIAYLATLK